MRKVENKSQNKGFTLVELLAVIVILNLLIGLVLVQASKTIRKANTQYYHTQEKMILLAAKEYFNDYRSHLSKEVGATSEVLLATLEDELYIDFVVDVNQEHCDGLTSKVIVKKKDDTDYQYQVSLVCPKGNYQTKIE